MYLFIQENAFENVVWKMVAILSGPQCVNSSSSGSKIMLSKTRTPGGRLNIKTVLSTYGDFHVKDKTAVRTSYL